MRFLIVFCLSLLAIAHGDSVAGQQKKGDKKADKKSEEAFLKEKPAVGDAIPDLVVYSPEGKEVKTSELRGHYTVLAFGCLT